MNAHQRKVLKRQQNGQSPSKRAGTVTKTTSKPRPPAPSKRAPSIPQHHFDPAAFFYSFGGLIVLFGITSLGIRVFGGPNYITLHNWGGVAEVAGFPGLLTWLSLYIVIADPSFQSLRLLIVGACSLAFVGAIVVAAMNRHADKLESVESGNHDACGRVYEQARELDGLSKSSEIGMKKIQQDTNRIEAQYPKPNSPEAFDKALAFSQSEYLTLRQQSLNWFLGQASAFLPASDDVRNRLGKHDQSRAETMVTAVRGNSNIFSAIGTPKMVADDLRGYARQLCPTMQDTSKVIGMERPVDE